MKVALLTYHYVYNHGANLQALASILALQNRGCEVEVIDYRQRDLQEYYRKNVPEEQAALHEKFVGSNLPLSPFFRTGDEIRDYYRDPANRPDVVVAGSDTLLYLPLRNPPGKVEFRYGNPYWLNWLDDTPELQDIPTTYLSVSSTGSWYFMLDRETRCKIIQSLNRRSYITVRDRWTRWMMRSLSPSSTKEMTIDDNFDPVFVLNRHYDFEKQDITSLDLPERYVLFNVPHARCSRKWAREFGSYARQEGYEVLAFPNPQGEPHWDELRTLFPLCPLEWYKVIRNAAGYLGERFHPIVVSLCNQVPFVSVDPYGLSPLALLGANYPSKTFDVCKKARRRRLVIKSRFFPLYSPKAIFRKLINQDSDTTGFVKHAQSVFDKQVDRILALASGK